MCASVLLKRRNENFSDTTRTKRRVKVDTNVVVDINVVIVVTDVVDVFIVIAVVVVVVVVVVLVVVVVVDVVVVVAVVLKQKDANNYLFRNGLAPRKKCAGIRIGGQH